MLDLGQLRSFVVVAERGTIAAASRKLGYTPPAISQHIAKLEAELGVALFDRVAGRLTLTPAGERLVPLAHEMTDLDDAARTAVDSPCDDRPLVVAGFASAIESLVIPRLDELRDTMTLELVEAEDAEAMRELALGTVDLVLTQEYEPIELEPDARFVFEPLVRDELTLVLPPRSPPTTRLADVADEAWMLNGDGTRCAQATARVLAAAGIAPSVRATVNDNTTLLALVAAGHGVTIVPELVLRDRAHEVVVSDQALGVGRTIYGVTRRAVERRVRPLVDVLASADGRA